MKQVTAINLFNDEIGKRIGIVFAEYDETGKIISDNNIVNRVLIDLDAIDAYDAIKDFAQEVIDNG